MAKTLLSIRLSPALSRSLDRLAEMLDCSPAEVLTALLRASAAHRAAILSMRCDGAWEVKRTFRLSPDALAALPNSAERSEFIRRTLAHFFQYPELLREVFADTLADLESEEEEEDGSEVRVPSRQCPQRGGAVAGLCWAVIPALLVVALPFLAARMAPPQPNPRPQPSPGDSSEGSGPGTSAQPP